MKPRMPLWRIGNLQRPCQGMRHMHAVPAGGNHRQHIGFQRIAHHHGARRAFAVTRENRGVSSGGLVRHDFDAVKQITQTRLRKFAFLIQQIALGDQQNAVILGQCFHSFTGMRQQIYRMRQHVAPGGHKFGNHRGGHPAICHLNRGFDHRQREPLHAKAVMPQIAPFGGQKAVMQVVRGGKISQQAGKAVLRQAKERLVLPQCIICIKSDCGDMARGHGARIAANARRRQALPLFTNAKSVILRYLQDCLPFCQRCTFVTNRPLSMSDTPNGPGRGPGDDVSILTKPKTKSERPPLYKVMLLNDDYTPREFVVHVLERFFGLTHAQSFDIMLTVHKKGLAVVGVFSHEIAETKVAQVMDFARRHQHPLQCTMEKE